MKDKPAPKRIWGMKMKKNISIYILAALLVFAVKVFYRTADSDMLLWILAPTTWWVRILSGIAFVYNAQVGYVSHAYRFIIAPSCSGVRFMLLVFVMMVFSYTHLIANGKKKFCWLGFSAIFSYITTIFVNGIRITVSIYLPLMMTDSHWMPRRLSAERLHTVIGTTVYFSMLFVIYYIAGKICNRLFVCAGTHALVSCCTAGRKEQGKNGHFAAPVFWYFVMVLAIPFAGRFYRNDWTGFLPYALLVTGVCAVIVLVFIMFGNIWRLKR